MDTLRDLAEYSAVPSQDVKVEQTSSEGATSRLGVNKAVDAGRATEKTASTVESYEVVRRPVQLLNDVILRFERDEAMITAGEDDDLPSIPHRSVVEISGELEMLPASEIAQYFDLMLPLMQQNDNVDDIPVSSIVSSAVAPGGRQAPLVFKLTRESSDDEPAIVTVLDPKWLRDADVDDLEGPAAIFGLVDRLIAPEKSLSLKRYVMPQVSRAIRRALEASDALEETVSKLSELSGQSYRMEDLEIIGPAIMVSTVAIYSS